jgi:hypothetical protein
MVKAINYFLESREVVGEMSLAFLGMDGDRVKRLREIYNKILDDEVDRYYEVGNAAVEGVYRFLSSRVYLLLKKARMASINNVFGGMN